MARAFSETSPLLLVREQTQGDSVDIPDKEVHSNIKKMAFAKEASRIPYIQYTTFEHVANPFYMFLYM